jgi:membrane protein implicated in regulation of membrane protease activity
MEDRLMDDRGQGWLIFSAVVLGVAGIMRILDSIWAFRYHGTLPQNLQNAIYGSSLKTYGWIWLIVGIVLILAALAVVSRNQLARWVGIFAGAVMAVTALGWLPYYPIWSLVYIGMGVAVIWGLSAYGGHEYVTAGRGRGRPERVSGNRESVPTGTGTGPVTT